MQKLIIKNIGAIRQVEFDVNRINVFMGPQSSGKSTLSKILCHCQWVEKSCFLSERQLTYFRKRGMFYQSLVEYHKLDGYFHAGAYIRYEGEAMTITYTHVSKKTTIELKEKMTFAYPKLCYIPSERNFVAGVSNFGKYNEGNNVLLYFGYDWNEAKENIKKLDITGFLGRNVAYENVDGKDYIVDNGSKLLLTNASSGIQSVLPLYQTVRYMLYDLYKKNRALSPSRIRESNLLSLRLLNVIQLQIKGRTDASIEKDYASILLPIFNLLESHGVKAVDKLADLSHDELADNVHTAVQYLDTLFNYRFTRLFIEEPEQNLFPDTQQELIYWLLMSLQDETRPHAAVITTHSPYILFALNNCMMGGLVGGHIPEEKAKQFASYSAWIDPKSVSVFELHEGTICGVQDEDGILEDNYLNKAYKKNSEEYLQLLNYYDDEAGDNEGIS